MNVTGEANTIANQVVICFQNFLPLLSLMPMIWKEKEIVKDMDELQTQIANIHALDFPQNTEKFLLQGHALHQRLH